MLLVHPVARFVVVADYLYRIPVAAYPSPVSARLGLTTVI